MKVIITSKEGFKDKVFEGVQFPVAVEAKKIRSGIMKGWVMVTYAEFEKHGLTVPEWVEDFKHEYDHGFEFSPEAFQQV